jgi:3-isopropylmalate dehydrogenase
VKEHKVAVIEGDGVGPEIIREGKKVIDAIAPREGFKIDWIHFPHGAEHYLKTGEILSDQSIKELGKYKAIYLGAVGDPRVEPGLIEQGVGLKIRFTFDQYVNLRPVKLLEGVTTPIKNKGPKDIDFVVLRENIEDFYIGVGGRVKKGVRAVQLEMSRKIYKNQFKMEIETDSEEIGFQLGIISREGANRIIKYGFDLARETGKNRVTMLDKANVLPEMYNLWRNTGSEVAKNYPGIELEFMLADAATMYFIKNPEHFQVVVAPNLFGDIVTDLGAGIAGGLGLAPGANINPVGTSMFEPIHGSAPKHAGKGIVNPIATIWAGALMLDFLGEKSSAVRIIRGIEDVLREGKVLTYDLGGKAKTTEMGNAIAAKVVA